MKKPKGVSLEESLFERVKVAAKNKRESASKWIEDAIYERFDRINESPNSHDRPPTKPVRYSKPRRKK